MTAILGMRQGVNGVAKDILVVKNIKKYFPTKTEGLFVKAVDGISFTIRENEVVGLVGESGSGKSTTAYAVMGMHSITDGEMRFKGEDISMAAKKRPLHLKRDIQIVFQDPGTSLNPKRTIGNILITPLKVHNIVPKEERFVYAQKLLEIVGLSPAFAYKYPGALGGGERQLVAIARALSTNPSFMVLDEPTSSLDVSVQAKIINTLMDIRKKRGISYLFITHDMSLMRNIADRIAIMYLGRIVEMAETEKFFERPQHPYTRMLISSIPVVLASEEKLKPDPVESQGEIPSPVNVPNGCGFHTRCPYATEKCAVEMPPCKEVSEGHQVWCHYPGIK